MAKTLKATEQEKAARIMLAALEQAAAIVPVYIRGNLITQLEEAIAAAKAAGIGGK